MVEEKKVKAAPKIKCSAGVIAVTALIIGLIIGYGIGAAVKSATGEAARLRRATTRRISYEQCVEVCQEVVCLQNEQNLQGEGEMEHCMENCNIDCADEGGAFMTTGLWSWIKSKFKRNGDGDGGGSGYDGYFKWKDEGLDCLKGAPPQCDTKA